MFIIYKIDNINGSTNKLIIKFIKLKIRKFFKFQKLFKV